MIYAENNLLMRYVNIKSFNNNFHLTTNFHFHPIKKRFSEKIHFFVGIYIKKIWCI